MTLTEFQQQASKLVNKTFTKEEKKLVNKALELLKDVFLKHKSSEHQDKLDKLLAIMNLIIFELNLNYESLTSAILFLVRRFEPFEKQFLENQYSKNISRIVEGIVKITEVKVQRITEESISKELKNSSISRKKLKEREKERVAVQTENYITLLLTLAEDVRSILVKLALVLFDMRNIQDYKEEVQQRLAIQTSVIYAPIAHRLGLYAIKTELEELSMKKLHNDMFVFIKHKLNEQKEKREQFIKDFIAPIKKHLKKEGIPAHIKGRPKSIYSIWNKMIKQDTVFEKIYDLFAIRIILTEPFFEKADNELRPKLEKAFDELSKIPEAEIGKKKEQQEKINEIQKELDEEIKSAKLREKKKCWDVYSYISNWYEPNPNRLRDWISNPKETGYESLHTTVAVPHFDKKWVEVQIRTQRMDEVAEKGQAAHWKYKTANKQSGDDALLEKLRTILENTDPNSSEEISSSKTELYSDKIFVFTPKGDLKKLINGATLLDFAYAIHTKVGDTCIGGEVNGKHVPLKYELQNGDRINVKTSANQKPSTGWLDIAETGRALKKIQLTLKESQYKDAAAGKDTLMFKFKQQKLELKDDILMKLCNELGYKKTIDLYQAVGEGKIEATEIKDTIEKIQDEEKSVTQKTHQKLEDNKFEKSGSLITEEEKTDEYLLIGDNMKGLDFEIAKCCNPKFGDNIFGFVTIAKGTKIHKVSCPNAAEMMSRYPYRVVKAQWNAENSNFSYMSNLIITGIDSVGIVSNITSLVKKETDVKLHSIKVDSKDGMFKGKLSLYAKNKKSFDKFANHLNTVKGVLKVQ